MTASEFVIWMKGFVEAANTFNITPKQWDTICEHLEKVKDPTTYHTPIYHSEATNSTGKVLLTSNS